MPLSPDQLLLHYRIVEKIGEGGMGAVWKALDTQLDREVAIKVLPEQFALDAERLARFEREAKLLASLNHPNIAGIYGLHSAVGIRFLSMELVHGEDLQQRLARGPLPLNDALSAARQIAEALEAAHDNGVIHRDLKPANVVMNNEGQVKVLDFGLAKALDPSTGSDSADPSLSPTLTSAGTVAGVILGTAAYMSPEQARGHTADRRADIWSFGVLLHEMITGKTMFTGETISDTLAAVLRADVDLGGLPSDTPAGLKTLLTRCLDRNRKTRLQAIGEARIALEQNFAGEVDAITEAEAAFSLKRLLPWAIALAGIAVAVFAMTLGTGSGADADIPHRRFVIEDENMQLFAWNRPVISPDGKRIAYRADQNLVIRDLDSLEPRVVPGSEGVRAPFWSPDSAYLAFDADSKLWKVPAEGGRPVRICEIPGRGRILVGAWSPRGEIAIAVWRGSIYTVSPQGGDPVERVKLDPETEVDFHTLLYLPDGETLVTTPHNLDQATREWKDLGEVVAIRGDQRTPLLQSAEYTFGAIAWSTDGYLLYERGGANEGIWAATFDPGSLERTGDPILLAPEGAEPSVSAEGTMTWVQNQEGSKYELFWMDRSGNEFGSLGQPAGNMRNPSISPDGTRVAYSSEQNENIDIWIQELSGGAPTRLTFATTEEEFPRWSPDSRTMIFDSDFKVTIMPVDGTGEMKTLFPGTRPWVTPDGNQVLYHYREKRDDRDIWLRPLDGSGEPKLILGTPAEELGHLSPAGDYLAYMSDESGVREVYLTRFPDGTGKWQVTNGGAWSVLWAKGGDELIYRDIDGDLVAVPIRRSPSLHIGVPQVLIPDAVNAQAVQSRGMDATADGERFVMIRRVRAEGEQPGIVVVQNWTAGL